MLMNADCYLTRLSIISIYMYIYNSSFCAVRCRSIGVVDAYGVAATHASSPKSGGGRTESYGSFQVKFLKVSPKFLKVPPPNLRFPHPDFVILRLLAFRFL